MPWRRSFHRIFGAARSSHPNQEVEKAPIEQHGFVLLDFDPGKITVRFFRWDVKSQSPQDIERLQPFRTTVLTPAA